MCFDRVAQKHVNNASIGGLIPVLTQIPRKRKQTIADKLCRLSTRFGIPSQDPGSSEFERYRYWRGPIWLIINYMICDGLMDEDHHELSQRICETSIDLIKTSGFAEYYDPIDGLACGGQSFSWTAAIVLEFIDKMHEPCSYRSGLKPQNIDYSSPFKSRSLPRYRQLKAEHEDISVVFCEASVSLTR